MKNLRALIILISSSAVLLSGCSSEKKLAGHMEKAETYMAAGEYDKAEIELKNAIRLDTESMDPAALLGQIYFEQGRLAQAAPILYAVAQEDPENLDNRVNLALVFLASGRVDDARSEALAVLEARPGDNQAPIILAEGAQNAESIAEARSTLQSVEATQGPTAATKVGLATLAFREEELELAGTLIADALEIDPEFAPALAARGSLEWAQGETDSAMKSLSEAAELSPLRSARRIQYARFLRQNGKSEAATTYVEGLIAKAPDYLPALILAAEMAIADQNPDQASLYLEKALSRDPSHPGALQLKGRLALDQRKLEEAIETFERVLSLYPGNAAVHHQLALAYLAQEDRGKAIANLKQAVSLAPDFSEAILLLAQLEIRSGGATDAVLSLKALVERQPDLTQAQVLLADAYRAQGNLEGALGVYQDLTARFPDSPQGHLAEGIILMQQGNRPMARAAFSKALEVAPDYMPAAEQLINLDLAGRDIAAAETRARTLVASYPDRQETHFLLARVLLAGGKVPDAEVSLQQAIDINPEARTPQMLMVNIYLQTERLTEATEKLGEVIDQDPEDVGALTLLAMTQQQLGDLTAPQAIYERILEIDPDLVAALNNLAYIYSEETDRPEEAFELAQRARELAPNDPFTADTLGWIVFKRGDYDWAISLLQESADRLPDQPEVLYHLGMAQYMAGRAAEAAANLTTALALRDDFPGSESARARLAVLAVDPQTADSGDQEVLETTLNDFPDDPVALTKLGNMTELGDDRAAAAEAYQQALDAQPEYVAAMVGLARLQEDPARALELAREAYKLDPENAEAAGTVGRLAFEQGEYSWAVSVLQNAARKEPENTELAYDLARALFAVGRLADASDQLEKVLKAGDSFPRSDEARTFSDLVELADSPAKAALQLRMIQGVLASDPDSVPALMAHGMALEQQGKTGAADEEYRKVLAIYPDFTPATRRLALIMARDPIDLDAAYSMASKARQAFPRDAEVAGALGKLAYLKDNYRRAITLLGEATRADNASAENWFYLGMAQVKSGDVETGKTSLGRASAMGLEGELQREAESALTGGASGS